jgi:hypothetical protein
MRSSRRSGPVVWTKRRELCPARVRKHCAVTGDRSAMTLQPKALAWKSDRIWDNSRTNASETHGVRSTVFGPPDAAVVQTSSNLRPAASDPTSPNSTNSPLCSSSATGFSMLESGPRRASFSGWEASGLLYFAPTVDWPVNWRPISSLRMHD